MSGPISVLYRVHDGEALVGGVLLLAQRPLESRRHGLGETGQRLWKPDDDDDAESSVG